MEIKKYSPPPLLPNGHLQTIYPALFRHITVPYQRERMVTPDDDFLDLDWLTQFATKLVILSHGLEGNSTRAYMTGMANHFFRNGYDVLAWNYRGCSEEMNHQLRFYHSGATDDLDCVVRHAVAKGKYIAINLIGFSLGGNITLKYLGEQKDQLIPELKKAVVFSVPLHLHSSCLQISSHWIYAQRFLKSLKKKIIDKSKKIKTLDVTGMAEVKTLIHFDDRYTAPLHGFDNAFDYYQRCSSLYFIDHVQLPTLIVNALNDPFLSEDCYPLQQVKHHRYVQLETPDEGGHCGFASFNRNGVYWSEVRALEFIRA